MTSLFAHNDSKYANQFQCNRVETKTSKREMFVLQRKSYNHHHHRFLLSASKKEIDGVQEKKKWRTKPTAGTIRLVFRPTLLLCIYVRTLMLLCVFVLATPLNKSSFVFFFPDFQIERKAERRSRDIA